MSSTIVSLIRTYVPVAVGAFVAWLVTLGIDLDAEAQAGLVTALTGVLIAAYYGIVRALERRWPWVGVFLGVPAEPLYDRRTESERYADEVVEADRVAALNDPPAHGAACDDCGEVHRWHE